MTGQADEREFARSVTITEAGLDQRAVVANLLELYEYDFTEFDGTDLGDDGRYGYEYLDYYWREPGRHAFLIRVADKLAGLVLVRTIEAGHNPLRSIAEFFIMRKYRRRGVGRMVAMQVFDMFPGRWTVGQEANNLPSQAFWRNVIREYTGGRYTETWEASEPPVGPRQHFTCCVCSRPSARAR